MTDKITGTFAVSSLVTSQTPQPMTAEDW